MIALKTEIPILQIVIRDEPTACEHDALVAHALLRAIDVDGEYCVVLEGDRTEYPTAKTIRAAIDAALNPQCSGTATGRD